MRSNLDNKFDVYCNMTKGGWTVIMKRESKTKNVNFEQDMKNYKRGFGSLMTDHWLGKQFYFDKEILIFNLIEFFYYF